MGCLHIISLYRAHRFVLWESHHNEHSNCGCTSRDSLFLGVTKCVDKPVIVTVGFVTAAGDDGGHGGSGSRVVVVSISRGLVAVRPIRVAKVSWNRDETLILCAGGREYSPPLEEVHQNDITSYAVLNVLRLNFDVEHVDVTHDHSVGSVGLFTELQLINLAENFLREFAPSPYFQGNSLPWPSGSMH